ncbi:YchJ family metal-binding protein [Rhodoferax saidenbachensis]|uniref:SEC-C motif-containing protein n=1 Tax=Rhodoferax saidenbachensis TaxID=1484693 RepID=A0ABU1ZRG3_9BURK|nr:YchJ family metal-binding protein [Rhodoferax saidenbachensis]MDR7308078.1 SEC-C motif-containing protein [Rhodoferax saidenbachensis]
MKSLDPDNACPCGRLNSKKPAPYGQCCGRWLDSDTPAPDAESLMRSRYCAFALERAPYLLRTWHASHRPSSIEFEPGVKWLGLEVRSHTVLDATHAEVEFVARQKPLAGPAVRLHERSRFVWEDGHWLYVDGDAL